MEEQTDTPVAAKQTKLIAALAIGFGLFHGVGMLLAVLPADWGANRLFEPYRKLTGSQQQWDMFSTIPIALDQQVTVDFARGDGGMATAGPILPGLREFDLDSRIRYYPLLHRLMARDGDYLGSYLAGVEAALAEETGGDVREFSLRSETDFVRLIKRIDEDGQMTVRKSEVIGPIVVGD